MIRSQVGKNYNFFSVCYIAWQEGYTEFVYHNINDKHLNHVFNKVLEEILSNNEGLDDFLIDNEEEFLKLIDYLTKLHNKFYNHNFYISSNDILDFVHDHDFFSEDFFKKQNETNQYDFFTYNWKFKRKIIDSVYYIIAPLFSIKYKIHPVSISFEDFIYDLKLLLTDHDPLKISFLYDKISENEDLHKKFLKLILLNDSHFLTVEKNDIEYVDLANEVFLNWDLATCVLNTLDYVNMKDLSSYSKKTYDVIDYHINFKNVKNFFNFHSDNRFLDFIDPLEVCVKLYENSQKIFNTIQKIPEPIYNKIIGLLEKQNRQLSNAQLSKFLGKKFILEPYDLIPGRILAYGVNLSQLTNKNCGFVLSDWVSSTIVQEPRKIHRERILTPLQVKNIIIKDNDVSNIFFKTELYKLYGLIDVDNLKFLIGRSLRIDKNDYFHLEMIRQKIIQVLKKDKALFNLSNNIFCNSIYEDICVEKISSQKKRARCFQEIRNGKPWYIFREELDNEIRLSLEKLT